MTRFQIIDPFAPQFCFERCPDQCRTGGFAQASKLIDRLQQVRINGRLDGLHWVDCRTVRMLEGEGRRFGLRGPPYATLAKSSLQPLEDGFLLIRGIAQYANDLLHS